MAEEDPAPPADGDAAPPPPPRPPLTPEILAAFYENLDGNADPDVAADALAESLELRDRTTDSRVGSRVDFIFNALDFARDAGLTPAQTVAVHEVGQAMLDACAAAPGPSFSFADAESLFQSTILPKVAAEPDREAGQFSITDVRAVSDYFAKGFFQHFSLWRFVWSEEQEMEKHETFKRVEFAYPARPLPDFLTEEANDARLAKEAEEAEAARIAAEEAAKEAAEAERLRLDRGGGREAKGGGGGVRSAQARDARGRGGARGEDGVGAGARRAGGGVRGAGEAAPGEDLRARTADEGEVK